MALAAAYAVALKALLLAFGPAIPAQLSVQLGELCSGGDSSGAPHPQDHSRQCQALCAYPGQAVSGAPPDAVAVSKAVLPAAEILAPAGYSAPLRIADRGPQNPRAPPLA
ncbi:MAG: hypothetical protein FJX62_14210 [Alphaproteobacteria bacterium]|nr:hypothetical protein [Alphaproteobacteria bacterium]